MRKTTFLTLCLLLLAVSSYGQGVTSAQAPAAEKQQLLWDKLGQEISDTDRGLDGVMGVAIEDLTTGKKFLLHSDEVFPQASSIKIAVLAELYHQAQLSANGAAGKAKLTDRLQNTSA